MTTILAKTSAIHDDVFTAKAHLAMSYSEIDKREWIYQPV
jgi:hypothetical protein